MAGPYQPTTVRNEEIDEHEVTGFCNPFFGRRHHDVQNSHNEHITRQDSDRDRQERVNQWLFTRCVSRQDGQTSEGGSSAVPTPAGSELHIPRRTTSTGTAPPSHLSRAQSITEKIIKNTENFFGLGDCDEEHANLQRKWTQRRKRHYHKRYGALVDFEDAVDGAPRQGKVQGTAASISSYQSSRPHDPNLMRTLSRRESVASLAWKKVKKLKDDPMAFKSPGKAQPVSMLLEAGRSFSPAVMSQLDEDEVDSAFRGEGVREGEDILNDEVFFSFEPEKPRRRKEKSGFLPGIEEEKAVAPAVPRVGKDEPDGPPAPEPRPPIRSTRGQRISDRPRVTNANRREYGKGMVGRLLNRTIKRKRLTSSVKKQIDLLTDHRPFFTYWISFVQTVVLIVGLAVYHFAPIGFTETTKEAVIDRSQAGTLVPSKVQRTYADNFWIGPNQAGLIKMGAKFAPCMRLDSNLKRVLEEERRNESETGCCVKSDGSGCIQTSQAECSRAFAFFYTYSKNNKTRVVCGQDPETCLDPPSVAPDKWDPNDITKWPECKKSKTNLPPSEYPHMTCEITGRPCCMGNEAKCRIVSKDECDFFNGTYHENKTLCAQVDCLSDTCGMLDFHRKDEPDQGYRLWMAIFAHAGIIHLACTLIFHFTIMRDLEKMAGWLRLSIIYILSGIGGYLYSAILLPYQAEVGPSGSIFGVIACLFVELFQSWQMIARPVTALIKLCGIVLVLLLIGLLPYVDNFAHMIGFVFGFLLAFIFLPYVSFGEFDRRRKQIQIVVCFLLVISLFVVGFMVFYIYQGSTCEGCEYLNCVPLTEDFCKPYTRGQYLEPRAR